MSLKLKDLFARGAIFALHKGFWRAREALTPADLGIEDTADVRRALSLGIIRLAPHESMSPVLAFHGEANRILESNSLVFRMIPGARYVPTERTAQCSAELDLCRAKFNAAADAYASVLPSIIPSHLETIARGLTSALAARSDRNLLVASALARIAAEIPSATEIRRRFYLRWNVYVLDSIEDAEVSALADTNATVSDALSGMIGGLRDDVSERLAAIRAVLERGGKWTERSVNSAEALFERVERLNIFGDATLTALVNQARSLIRRIDPKSESQAGVLQELEALSDALAADTAEAAANAERALTTYARRKITMPVRAIESEATDAL